MATTTPDINLEHLKQFRFKELFNELGWDRPAQQQPYKVVLGEKTYELDVVAHKRGVQILQCRPDENGNVPEYSLRQKIERKITSEVREHLIVFTNAAKSAQVWQWVARASGRPNQYREVPWRTGESVELLRQKLRVIAFTLDEEETLSVLGVAQRLQAGFDRDKVTKKFYTEFDKQRKDFAKFMEGIPATGENLRWYTAVLIDRLMFLWFLQEKSFLDGKKTYLQDRLDKHLAGKPKATFYRSFLCPLFFRGFAEERTKANAAALEADFGNVPYLNGGLFAEHSLERQYGDALDVADSAFEKLFKFFSEWDWHLDDRPLASQRDINPDVLGYIFEKFVNQKQMGAYYTKEDITEYIGKNTIIPCLLAKVRAEHTKAFDDLAWPMLAASGDAYIYPPMLKGVDTPYPAEIAVGLDTEAPDLLERRKPWNKRANDVVSLPTEIWRETITRHQRTREMRSKLAAGDLHEIGDLITYNLDIRQFAQDLIERCTDIGLLKSFWVNLAGRLPRKSNEKFRHGLSVLDPTCGSGAFLFAALNILKPLYDASLRTLHAVRSDDLIAGKKAHPEKWAEVDEILQRFATVKSEREQDYAVTKHIIVHNLYGVDIEEQATEIAKLRLFLKLVALLEPGDDIEPLPDIDFNIRHGNTLVGYATADETEKAVKGATQGKLFSDEWDDIRIQLTKVEQAYNNFQIQQVQRGGHISATDKDALKGDFLKLEEKLNEHLAKEYGVDPAKAKKYETWKDSHKPFHWYVDFYALMASGGFDAVVGNPPYVETSNIDYKVRGFKTATCGDLYALCMERSQILLSARGSLGMIVPVSIVSADAFADMRRCLRQAKSISWSLNFAERPAKLFTGVEKRLTIWIMRQTASEGGDLYLSNYNRWTKDERDTLFSKFQFVLNQKNFSLVEDAIPKVCSKVEMRILERLSAEKPLELFFVNSSSHHFYYTRKLRYFVQFFDFVPRITDLNGIQRDPSELKELYLESEIQREITISLLNSSLFFWFFCVFSDVRNVNKREINAFRCSLDAMQSGEIADLRRLHKFLMKDFDGNSRILTSNYAKQGALQIQSFQPRLSKSIIDEIDTVLARHYKFTPEDVDFILNYDIKYRMGQIDNDDGDD